MQTNRTGFITSIPDLKRRINFAHLYPRMIIFRSWAYELNGRAYIRWFRGRLNQKINRDLDHRGRKYSDQYHIDQLWDRRIIEEYGNRIRRSGSRNLLRTPELRRRYPHINNQEFYI